MKFSDIKPFTGNPNYQIDIPLDYIKSTIDEFVKEFNLNLDPDFQRGYVWNDIQKSQYIEYILKGGMRTTLILFNHPGWQKNFKGVMVLVDGKQRLNAITEFFDNKVKVFNHYFNEFENKFPTTKFFIRFGINNLQTRLEVLNWYLELNSGGTIHTNEDLDKIKHLIKIEKEK